MGFSYSTVDKLRDNIQISDVISKKVKLQKKGKDFFGLCPFHHEKSPSFSVNDEKNFYHCFGCGAHGNSIKFIQETQNLSFIDAVKLLANEYNIKITQSSVVSVEKSKQKRILEINNAACSWFHENLFSQSNAHIVKYLDKRNIKINSINAFKIGYAADGFSLIKHLLSLGYSPEEMGESGIATEKNDKQVCRFRNRIIFPIKNSHGDVIAFGGRVISDNDIPKYLNSPETLVFKKKTAFYLEDIAFKNVKNTNTIFVVEGYTDAIAMHSIGITNTVATLGTAISEFHLKKLWSKVGVPTICMDGDRAGFAAMEKVIKIVLPLLKPGYSLKFIKLPTGYDPYDIIETHGSIYFKDLVNKTINLDEIIKDIYLNKIDIKTPENKVLFKEKLKETFDTISDLDIRKEYYNKHIYKKNTFKLTPNNSLITEAIKKLPVLHRYQHTLVAILLINPYLLKNDILFEKFSLIIPKTKDLDRTYSAIINCFAEVNSGISEDFSVEIFQKKIKTYITEAFFNYLCGSSSCFVDTITKKDRNDILQVWFDTFERYSLELMKEEYKFIMQGKDELSLKKAQELKKEIEALDKKIRIHIMNRYD